MKRIEDLKKKKFSHSFLISFVRETERERKKSNDVKNEPRDFYFSLSIFSFLFEIVYKNLSLIIKKV